MKASLLAGPVRVVNIGLLAFTRDLALNGAAAVQVDWAPPAGGNADLLAALAKLEVESVAQANTEALARILCADPVLIDVQRAGDLIAELDAAPLLLHAGPPLTWARMC